MKNKRLSVLISLFAVLILSVSFSFPVNAASYSGTDLKSTGFIIDTSVSGLNSFSGSLYYSNDINPNLFVGTGDGNVSNLYSSTGYIYWKLPIIFDRRDQLKDRINFQFNGFSFDITYFQDTVSYNTSDYFGSNGAGYLAVGPYNGVNSIDDFKVLHTDQRALTYVYPISDFDIYSLYYIKPFYSRTLGAITNYNYYCYLDYNINDLTWTFSEGDDKAATSGDISDLGDQLTNGFDSGGITESNTSLSGSLTQYDQAEAEITGQSVGFIDGVEFYDPASNAQLLTCITFCSSFLQSLFVNLGDWGILPMISLSLALGLMLVGWFKYRK